MSRLFSVFLIAILSLGHQGLCVAMPTMHACCPQEHRGCALEQPEKTDHVLACCTIQPASTTPTRAEADVFGTDDGLSLASFRYLPVTAFLEPRHQALRSQAYMADQSSRYLELRVLLN